MFQEDPHEMVLTADISSLTSLAGHNSPRSLRVWGKYNDHEVLVLIDSGSTYNFLKPSIATKLKIPVVQSASFHVYVRIGDALVCSSFCPKVHLLIQGIEFIMDLFILPIKGSGIVLGIQWL